LALVNQRVASRNMVRAWDRADAAHEERQQHEKVSDRIPLSLSRRAIEIADARSIAYGKAREKVHELTQEHSKALS
jgi:hypothetical protein